MPYLIELMVRGTAGDLAVRTSPSYDTRARADADMAKIREAKALWEGEKYAEATKTAPDWLALDAGSILSVSVGRSAARR